MIEDKPRCPLCDSENVEKTREGAPPEEVIILNYVCKDCGAEFEW